MALSVTQHVKTKLADSEELSAIVGDRVYPVNIPEGTDSFPFVVFDTSTGQPEYCKDGNPQDNHTITIYVIARHYMAELLPAAQAVRKALEMVTADYNTYSITSCVLESAVDGWEDQLQSYIYTLTFSMTSE